jgi:hypothetical protein
MILACFLEDLLSEYKMKFFLLSQYTHGDKFRPLFGAFFRDLTPKIRD